MMALIEQTLKHADKVNSVTPVYELAAKLENYRLAAAMAVADILTKQEGLLPALLLTAEFVKLMGKEIDTTIQLAEWLYFSDISTESLWAFVYTSISKDYSVPSALRRYMFDGDLQQMLIYIADQYEIYKKGVCNG